LGLVSVSHQPSTISRQEKPLTAKIAKGAKKNEITQSRQVLEPTRPIELVFLMAERLMADG
jgi:hypothetical protein